MEYFFHPEPPGELEGIHFGNAFNWNRVYEWLKMDDADLRALILHGPSGVGKEVTTKRLAKLTDREVRLLEFLDMPRQNDTQKANVIKLLNEYTGVMSVLAHQQPKEQKRPLVLLHGMDSCGRDVLAALREFVANPSNRVNRSPIICIVSGDTHGLLKLNAKPGTVLKLAIHRLLPKDMQEFAKCYFPWLHTIARDDPLIKESGGDMRKFTLNALMATLPAGVTGRESGGTSGCNDRRIDIFTHTARVLSSSKQGQGADPVDSDDRLFDMLQFNYPAACGEDMMAAAADAAEVFSAGDCLRPGRGPRTDAAEWMARSALVGGQELVDVKYPDSLKSGAGARRVRPRASSMWEGSQWKMLRADQDDIYTFDQRPYNFKRSKATSQA